MSHMFPSFVSIPLFPRDVDFKNENVQQAWGCYIFSWLQETCMSSCQPPHFSFSQCSSDTFSIELGNPSFNSNFTIANNVVASTLSITLMLPAVHSALSCMITLSTLFLTCCLDARSAALLAIPLNLLLLQISTKFSLQPPPSLLVQPSPPSPTPAPLRRPLPLAPVQPLVQSAVFYRHYHVSGDDNQWSRLKRYVFASFHSSVEYYLIRILYQVFWLQPSPISRQTPAFSNPTRWRWKY